MREMGCLIISRISFLISQIKLTFIPQTTTMPYKERDINKLYYTMGEVTEMFEVNASQIRFYEREFEILQPKKNKKGNRLFTQDDVENLRSFLILLRRKALPFRVLKIISGIIKARLRKTKR